MTGDKAAVNGVVRSGSLRLTLKNFRVKKLPGKFLASFFFFKKKACS
jgi:hypothetical protein